MNTPETDSRSHENKKTWFAIICRVKGDFRAPEGEVKELHRVQINGGPMRHLHHICQSRPHALEYHLAEGINAGVAEASYAVSNGTARPRTLGLHLDRSETELMRRVAQEMGGVSSEALAAEIVRSAVVLAANDPAAMAELQSRVIARQAREQEVREAIWQISSQPYPEKETEPKQDGGAA